MTRPKKSSNLVNVKTKKPRKKSAPASTRDKGSVARLWCIFPGLIKKGMRRVDIIEHLTGEGFKYWTVRSQLQSYIRATKNDQTSAR